MPIYLNKVARANPLNREEIKYYPSVKTLRMVDDDEIADLIADETTLNPMEAKMAIRQYHKVLMRILKASNSAKLGDIGTLHATCTGEGVETPEEVIPAKVKKVNLHLRSSKKVNTELNEAPLKMFDTLTPKV